MKKDKVMSDEQKKAISNTKQNRIRRERIAIRIAQLILLHRPKAAKRLAKKHEDLFILHGGL